MGRGVPSPWERGIGRRLFLVAENFCFFLRKNDVICCIFGTILSN